jgi:16S rRNA (uracil1498-N3)-methyltransferase
MSNEGAERRRRSAAHVLLGVGLSLDAAQLPFTDDIEHHLLRVVRLEDGELVSATDGAGSWRMFRTRRVGAGLVADAEGDVEHEPLMSPFTVASAIPKGDRVEWMVQKTTELGAVLIVLLDAEHSVVRWKPERIAKNVERLQRISDEATRQSRRVWRTTVERPVAAVEVLSSASIAEPGGEVIRGDETLIAIGPEGGWSVDEIARSARRVNLGDNILRVETAAIAATALRMARAVENRERH